MVDERSDGTEVSPSLVCGRATACGQGNVELEEYRLSLGVALLLCLLVKDPKPWWRATPPIFPKFRRKIHCGGKPIQSLLRCRIVFDKAELLSIG